MLTFFLWIRSIFFTIPQIETSIFIFINILSICCERDISCFGCNFLLIQYLVFISLIFKSMETYFHVHLVPVLLSLTILSNQVLSLTESFLSFVPKEWVSLLCTIQWQSVRMPRSGSNYLQRPTVLSAYAIAHPSRGTGHQKLGSKNLGPVSCIQYSCSLSVVGFETFPYLLTKFTICPRI